MPEEPWGAEPALSMPIAAFDPSKVRNPGDPRQEALDARERDTWRPVADLPEPEPQDGFVFRWIRTSNHNISDPMNVAKRFAERWEPVPCDSQPILSQRLGKYGVNAEGNIEIGGLMLCRMPNWIRDARNAYYANASATQVKAVDSLFMRDQDPRMPKLAPERSTTISTGSR
jgi:hypothetical protein